MFEMTPTIISSVQQAGTVLKDRRKAIGMTQAELAKKTGAAQSSISDIETGAVVPSLETYIRLLKVVGSDLNVVRRTIEHGLV